MQNRATGIADHLLPLGDLLDMGLAKKTARGRNRGQAREPKQQKNVSCQKLMKSNNFFSNLLNIQECGLSGV